MTMDEFAQELRELILERVPDIEDIQIKRVLKNNSVAKLGMLFEDKRSNVSPTIYLEEFYEAYRGGMDISKIADKIIAYYEQEGFKGKVDVSFMWDWGKVKPMVAYKLINKERNRELLEQIPNKDILDLSMVFFISVEQYKGSIMIYNSHCEMWGIGVDELYAAAVENTPKICPLKIQTMKELMGLGDAYDEDLEKLEPMYILSNEKKVCGAAAFLYPEGLKQVADRVKSDFYILPSSIHETIIFPAEETVDTEWLTKMVREVNDTMVVEEEILGDNVYFYSRESGELKMVA